MCLQPGVCETCWSNPTQREGKWASPAHQLPPAGELDTVWETDEREFVCVIRTIMISDDGQMGQMFTVSFLQVRERENLHGGRGRCSGSRQRRNIHHRLVVSVGVSECTWRSPLEEVFWSNGSVTAWGSDYCHTSTHGDLLKVKVFLFLQVLKGLMLHRFYVLLFIPSSFHVL